MEKQRVRINEEQLNRIVAESVKRVLKESFGDRVRGAVQGFKQGQNQQYANEGDASILQQVLGFAQNGLQNPQNAQQVLQNIVNYITKNMQNNY